ncbi:MAG: DUF2029 domain-containing protein [Pirellulales bacterium]|nr:DUF2029 domain-containing protein [Pirellulales bacterium]
MDYRPPLSRPARRTLLAKLFASVPFWLGANLFVGCIWLNSGYHGHIWHDDIRPRLVEGKLGAEVNRWLLPLRTFYHQGYDEVLYYEYANLVLGQPVDYEYLQVKHGEVPGFESMFAPRDEAAYRLPYRDMQVEYPPVALAVMLLPRPWVDSLAEYGVLFAIEMSLCLVGALYLAAWLAARHETDPESKRRRMVLALLYGVCFQLAFGILLLTQFDALVSLLVMAAIAAQLTGRPRTAAVALAAATSAKIFPILLLPLFLLSYLLPARATGQSADKSAANRQLAGSLLAFCVTLAVINVPFLWLGGQTFLDTFRFHAERGLQADSTWGIALTLLEKLGFAHYDAGMRFGAREITGPFVAGALLLSTFASVVLPLIVIATYASRVKDAVRHGMPEYAAALLPTYVLALTAGFMLTGKVLSPQFFIWLFPLVLLVPGEAGLRVRHTFLVAALLVQAGHPWLIGLTGINYPPTWLGWTIQAARVVCLARIFWLSLSVSVEHFNPPPRRVASSSITFQEEACDLAH